MWEQAKPLELDKLLAKLEKIADGYDPTSEDHAALLIAAKGLLFIHANAQDAAFGDYLERFDSELDEAQKARLKEMGIE